MHENMIAKNIDRVKKVESRREIHVVLFITMFWPYLCYSQQDLKNPMLEDCLKKKQTQAHQLKDKPPFICGSTPKHNTNSGRVMLRIM